MLTIVFLSILSIPMHLGMSVSDLRGEVLPMNINLIEGATLTLNCSIENDNQSAEFNSSSVFFEVTFSETDESETIASHYYETFGPHVSQLSIPNILMNGSGTYKCVIQNHMLGATEVFVGNAPLPVSNFSAISYNFERLVVEWSPCEPFVNYTVYWTVDSHLNDMKKIAINGSACSFAFCDPHDSNCGFIGCFGCFYQFTTYVINITGMNSLGRSDFSVEVYVDESLVKPAPVLNLRSSLCNESCCMLFWRCPERLESIPLIYKVMYTSQWNTSPMHDQDLLPDVDNYTMTGLTPYTVYSVRVSSKPVVGGYWSTYETLNITTAESVPAVAPQVPFGWFRIENCINNNCSVTIYWMSIPAYQRHGRIQQYSLTIRETSASFSFSGDQHFGLFQLPLATVTYHLTLRAVTAVGPSPSEQIILTMPSTDTPLLHNIIMETTEDGLGVTINWSVHEHASFDNFTLLYCVGKQDTVSRCDGEPMLIVIPGSERSVTLAHVESNWVFALSANTANASTGLSPRWLCRYHYHALPVRPQLITTEDITTDDIINVQWLPMTCDTSSNRAKVLMFVLRLRNVDSGDSVVHNISGNKNHFKATNLVSDSEYHVTLLAVSREGRGPEVEQTYTTKPSSSSSSFSWIYVIYILLSVLAVIVIVAVIWLCVRKNHLWKKVVIKTPANDFKSVVKQFTELYLQRPELQYLNPSLNNRNDGADDDDDDENNTYHSVQLPNESSVAGDHPSRTLLRRNSDDASLSQSNGHLSSGHTEASAVVIDLDLDIGDVIQSDHSERSSLPSDYGRVHNNIAEPDVQSFTYRRTEIHNDGPRGSRTETPVQADVGELLPMRVRGRNDENSGSSVTGSGTELSSVPLCPQETENNAVQCDSSAQGSMFFEGQTLESVENEDSQIDSGGYAIAESRERPEFQVPIGPALSPRSHDDGEIVSVEKQDETIDSELSSNALDDTVEMNKLPSTLRRTSDTGDGLASAAPRATECANEGTCTQNTELSSASFSTSTDRDQEEDQDSIVDDSGGNYALAESVNTGFRQPTGPPGSIQLDDNGLIYNVDLLENAQHIDSNGISSQPSVNEELTSGLAGNEVDREHETGHQDDDDPQVGTVVPRQRFDARDTVSVSQNATRLGGKIESDVLAHPSDEGESPNVRPETSDLVMVGSTAAVDDYSRDASCPNEVERADIGCPQRDKLADDTQTEGRCDCSSRNGSPNSLNDIDITGGVELSHDEPRAPLTPQHSGNHPLSTPDGNSLRPGNDNLTNYSADLETYPLMGATNDPDYSQPTIGLSGDLSDSGTSSSSYATATGAFNGYEKPVGPPENIMYDVEEEDTLHDNID